MDIISLCVGAAGVWLYSKLKNKNDTNKEGEKSSDNQSKQSKDNNDPILNRVIQLIDGGRNVFITGGAGTGKSYMLQQIKKHYLTMVLTSTTGVSAININGQTIHSWAGVGICKHSIESVANSIMKNSVKYKQLALCKMLAIDEISMLKSETMEYIDKVLKIVRNNNAPFGGI